MLKLLLEEKNQEREIDLVVAFPPSEGCNLSLAGRACELTPLLSLESLTALFGVEGKKEEEEAGAILRIGCSLGLPVIATRRK